MQFQEGKISNLRYIQGSFFDHKVFHGFFSRQGGMSKSDYEGLNVSIDVGDDERVVLQNRKLLESLIAMQTVYVKQVHSNRVELIDRMPKLRLEVDGLITRKKRLAICMQSADCQIAFFYDPMQQLIAAVHAGWRGLTKQIYQMVIEKLQSLGSNVKDLRVIIGPSLSMKHAEFIHWKQEFPKSWHRYRKANDLFDLKQIAFDQLVGGGLCSENIEILNCCNYEDRNYFSYRRDKTTGRCASVIAII